MKSSFDIFFRPRLTSQSSSERRYNDTWVMSWNMLITCLKMLGLPTCYGTLNWTLLHEKQRNRKAPHRFFYFKPRRTCKTEGFPKQWHKGVTGAPVLDFSFFSPKNVKFFLRNTLYHSFLHHYVSFLLLVRRRWTPNGRLVALTFHGMVSCIKSTENYKSEHETDWIYVFECSFL